MTGGAPDARVKVLIGSPLEPELVERLRAVDPRLEITHRPELLGIPRYHADHSGNPNPAWAGPRRTEAQAREFADLVAETEVLYDLDRQLIAGFPGNAPKLRWVQMSSAGVGQLAWRLGLDKTDLILTTSSGIHSTPLAEWVMFSMLWFAKDAPRLVRDQRAHRWERFCAGELPGSTMALIGLGRIGSEVARLGKAFGMRVLGMRRQRHAGGTFGWGELDGLYRREHLHALLREADYLVLVAPHTPETEGMIDRAALEQLKPSAVIVNIGRGQLIDEAAMTQMLGDGRLAGAAIDVFQHEPLPADNPLWDMPNVLINPHSASTSYRENGRICDLFADNLRRYLTGQPLRNVLDKTAGY